MAIDGSDEEKRKFYAEKESNEIPRLKEEISLLLNGYTKLTKENAHLKIELREYKEWYQGRDQKGLARKASLMDKIIVDGSLPKLLDCAFNEAFDNAEDGVESFQSNDSAPDIFYTHQVYVYLWKNLFDLSEGGGE
jgi:hypothetical protein